MEAWTQQQTDGTRLLRVDIDTWSSDVARQYGIRSLPTLYLFEGKDLVLKDTRAVLQRIQQP